MNSLKKDRKYKKFIRFLKKDLAKGFGIPKKALFGKEKYLRKYDKKLLRKQKKEDKIMEVEELAKELHEAGREAVEKKMTVVASLGLETPSKFLEWDEIAEDAKEGRRIQARYLLSKFEIKKFV